MYQDTGLTINVTWFCKLSVREAKYYFEYKYSDFSMNSTLRKDAYFDRVPQAHTNPLSICGF